MTDATRRFQLVACLVVAHVVVNLVHGLPHADVPIPLALWQNLLVVGFIVFPLVGLWLVRRGRIVVGGAAILAGGLGAAVFGTYYHFFSATPDNVARVTGPWSTYFLFTSVAISLLAIATAIVGAWLLASGRPSGE